MGLDPVARLGDKISHTDATLGQFIGAGVGLVVGAAVIIGIAVATGGVGLAVAVPVLVGCTVGGAGLGKWIGAAAGSTETGEITEGASRTFVGPNIRKVARFKDGIECQDSLGANMSWTTAAALIVLVGPLALAAKGFSTHSGAFVNDGRWNVQVEGMLISFIGSKTSCDGDVSKGIDGETETARTLVDGPIVGILARSELKGDNPVMEWSLFILDWAGVAFGIGAAEKILLPVTAAILKGATGLAEKTLGPTHPATITLGVLTTGVGLADSLIGSHTAKPGEVVAQGTKLVVDSGLATADQVPKWIDAAGGGTKELADVPGAESMREAQREGLRTDYGPLGTAPGMPWWVSWSGRTTK